MPETQDGEHVRIKIMDISPVSKDSNREQIYGLQ